MTAANTPNPWPTALTDRQEAVRRRAEQIYERNGKIPGHDLENWAQAEQEIVRESAAPARRAAVVIKIKGTEYIGEYNSASADGYRPGEFGPSASVLVTFRGDHMHVLRPNGKILETTITRKTDRREPDASLTETSLTEKISAAQRQPRKR
jgi:hypothetical protein